MNRSLLYSMELLKANPICVRCQVIRRLQTSRPHQALPPMLWALVKPALKLGAVLYGRASRKWWQSLPGSNWQRFKNVYRENRRRILISASVVGGTSAVYVIAHLRRTPITGRWRFVPFTQAQFQKVAQVEFDELYEQNKHSVLSKNSPEHRLIERICSRLVKSSVELDLVGKNWEIFVVKSKDINAVAFPNHKIVVTTGLMKEARSIDEIACIIGHEMSHAILEHGAEKFAHSALLDMAIIFPMGAIWMVIPSDGIAVITQWFLHRAANILLDLPYSRYLENEADEVGMMLAAKACFDVRQAPNFWRRMSDSFSVGNTTNGPIEPPQVLSTHPSSASRAQRMEQLMDRMLLVRLSCGCDRLPDNRS